LGNQGNGNNGKKTGGRPKGKRKETQTALEGNGFWKILKKKKAQGKFRKGGVRSKMEKRKNENPRKKKGKRPGREGVQGTCRYAGGGGGEAFPCTSLTACQDAKKKKKERV